MLNEPGIQVMKAATLSEDYSVVVTVSLNPDDSRVEWKPGVPSRRFTAQEAFEYGQVTARAWSELARLSRKNLVYVGGPMLAEGLRAGGATEVELGTKEAIAFFKGDTGEGLPA